MIDRAVLYLGDCREILPTLQADAVVTDPPYGVTSLDWDRTAAGWLELVAAPVLWCFGSMRFFMGQRFDGWNYAQEIVWEKHNGSIFHADRFRRVHEIAMQFYKGDWASVYKSPVMTMDATKHTMRRKQRPSHSGNIGASSYESHDGGPKLMRSVIYARSCHGYAIHPTQKPVDVLAPLIEYSVPPDGVVLDPFGGSFSTGVAALKSGRQFIGIENDEARFEAGLGNLRDSLAQGQLLA